MAPGDVISHYRVISTLGSGGMGEVFLAQDTSLDRSIALKILPSGVANHPERLRRFIREAKAASALCHPNVAQIYELGEADGVWFIAMEVVDGITLTQKIDSRPMDPFELLDVAVQVTEALTEAHRAGITHRDIKPANIMITRRGLVKVLDFGVAQIESRADLEDGSTDTLTEVPKQVLGTVKYMSPEAALGRQVDSRTDIFSLGVVLYRMATGSPPFKGENSLATFAAILHENPAWPPFVNPELRRIIEKALEKDLDLRYQSAADLRADLKRLKRDLEAGKHGAPLWHWVTAIAMLAVLGAAAAYGIRLWRQRNTPPPPEARIVPFTTYPGIQNYPALSPDGNLVAFVWNGEKEDNVDIYVKQVGAGVPLRLTDHPAIDTSPVWSPDGRFIAFLRASSDRTEILMVPALGGAERRIVEAPGRGSTPAHPYLDWSPDGQYLAASLKASAESPFGLYLISVSSGEKRALTPAPPGMIGDSSPVFSPDGRAIAFVRTLASAVEDIYLLSLNDRNMPVGEPKRLTTDAQYTNGLAWTHDSREIVYSARRGARYRLWRVQRGGGTPDAVAAIGENAAAPSIARHADRLVYTHASSDSNIWRFEAPSFNGRALPPVKLIASTYADHSPQYSPDGKRIVFSSDRSGSYEIWVCQSDGSKPVQLTSMNGPLTGTPRWSPDGQQIVFDSRPDGNADIYAVSPEGGAHRRLTTDASEDIVPSWSRDGKWIYFGSNRSGALQIWKIPSSGGPAVQVTREGGFEAFESADGKVLYYSKGRGVSGIWKLSLPRGAEIPFIADVSSRYWEVVEQGIYFAHLERLGPGTDPKVNIRFLQFATGEIRQAASPDKPPLAGTLGLSVSPDQRSILYAQLDEQSSGIMLVENFR